MIRRLRHACRVLPLVLGLGLIATAAGSEPVAPVAAADTAATAADPAADPWLAEEGPPVAAPARMPTEKVIESWQGAPATPRARAAAVRPVRLEQGLGDLLAPAITLLRDPSDEEPETKAALARELAPGVPAVQMANVRALWNAGDHVQTRDVDATEQLQKRRRLVLHGRRARRA